MLVYVDCWHFEHVGCGPVLPPRHHLNTMVVVMLMVMDAFVPLGFRALLLLASSGSISSVKYSFSVPENR